MPYIAHADRLFVGSSIDKLIEDMLEVDGVRPASAGLVNYVISRIVSKTMKPELGWSYSSLSKALAVFRDAESEMRRRLLDPYENAAIRKNGDIPEYESPS